MNKEELEIELFEEAWKNIENTNGMLNFCNDQLKYAARLAWLARANLNLVITEKE